MSWSGLLGGAGLAIGPPELFTTRSGAGLWPANGTTTPEAFMSLSWPRLVHGGKGDNAKLNAAYSRNCQIDACQMLFV